MKKIFLIIPILILWIINFNFAEELPILEIDTEVVVEFKEFDGFNRYDPYYRVENEIYSKGLSYNILTEEIKTYDAYKEFAKVYEKIGDRLIVSRAVKVEENKYRSDFYWYEPSSGMYKRFGNLGSDKIDSYYAGSSNANFPHIIEILVLLEMNTYL